MPGMEHSNGMQADQAQDTRLARHLTSLFYETIPEHAQALIPLEQLKEYVAFARTKVHPVIGDDAAPLLAQGYLDMRMMGQDPSGNTNRCVPGRVGCVPTSGKVLRCIKRKCAARVLEAGRCSAWPRIASSASVRLPLQSQAGCVAPQLHGGLVCNSTALQSAQRWRQPPCKCWVATVPWRVQECGECHTAATRVPHPTVRGPRPHGAAGGRAGAPRAGGTPPHAGLDAAVRDGCAHGHD